MMRRVLKDTEDNSACIGQIADYLTTHTHDGRYYTETEVDTLLTSIKTNFNSAMGIGSGNVKTINLVLEGFYHSYNIGADIRYYYLGQTNGIFAIPLPYTINDLDGNTKNLIVTQTNVGIETADANDYIDNLRWYGWTDENSQSQVLADATNYNSSQEVNWNHADTTIGGVYKRFLLYINNAFNASGDLKLSYLQVQYYYG